MQIPYYQYCVDLHRNPNFAKIIQNLLNPKFFLNLLAPLYLASFSVKNSLIPVDS